MREFKDDMGRSWSIHISCASLKRVEAHAGFDFADVGNGKAVEMFGGSTTHVLDVLWPLVQADAEKRGIAYDSFGEGLRGDCLTDAIAALKEELLSFFPSSRRRLMQKLIERMDAIVEQAGQQAEVEIGNVQMGTVTGGISPTSAPESSASTQTDGPSASS